MKSHVRRLLSVTAAITSVLAVSTAAAAAQQATAVAAVHISSSSSFYTIGTPVTFTFSPDGPGATPVKYQYQVNGGRERTVRAQAGQASVTLTPATRTSKLTVVAVGGDGSTSGAALDIILAGLAHPAADKDSDGDGFPDLIIAGNPQLLGSGVWLAPGRPGGAATGRVKVPAVNVGLEGAGTGAADFDEARVITGNFLGNGFQDVLAYIPTGYRAGGGWIISGTNDGSPMWPYSGNELNISSGILSDVNGDSPLELANAYNASGISPIIPDLISTNGSASQGYHLNYLFNQGASPLNYVSVQLPNATPTGGMDWENWRLASLSLPSGAAMFLWNPSTGALFLWEGMTFTLNEEDGSGSLAVTQYLISDHWTADAGSILEAADFTGDGIPDLWVVDPAGSVTSYVVSHLSATGPARISKKTPQSLA